jgi:SAM-dependent methyltransferase
MPRDILSEIHDSLPAEGPGRTRYTRKAFRMLSRLEKPRILDIGSGAGEPTLELARLTQGEIVGIDINQPALDRFKTKIEKAGLSNRVKALNCSMFNMDFPDESFDILWSEGSIFNIGFARGLKDWRRLLRPKGFLVVHDMVWLHPDPPKEIYDYWKRLYSGIGTVPENLAQIASSDYTLVGHFALPEDAWWISYFGPLEQRIRELRVKYTDDSHALQVLDKEQREVDMHKKYYRWYGSAYFIMQKK